MPHSVQHEGVNYLAGSEGSLILGCRTCGRDRFRDPFVYFRNEHRDMCWAPCDQEMEPIRLDDIDTVWRPLWAKTAELRHNAWIAEANEDSA